MIEKRQAALLSLASAPVVLSWGKTKQDSSGGGLLFGFNVITVNPRLVTGNNIWRRFS
jgi:hypothetical protein